MARHVPAASHVQVNSKTWSRDSHELFDFEAHNLHPHSFTVTKNMTCLRNGIEVSMIGERDQAPPGAEALLRLVLRDGFFWVDKSAPSQNSKKLWVVVRELPGGGHRLNEGDVLKLGRFKFRVRQLVASTTDQRQPELRLEDTGACCGNEPDGKDLASLLCRICLLEGPGEDDPLISPCQCKGSIEFVHLGCLRHWIRGRLNLSDTPGGSYFYRPLACELCKAIYPTTVQNGSERQPLVEVPWTQAPFIVLENMVRDSQQHSTRGLHVVSLVEKALKLGRGHESDVRIADVSISRCHATIKFTRGHFLLEDNASKFGTLVQMKKPRLLEAGTPISIQMGRTVLTLQAQPSAGGDAEAGAFAALHAGSSALDERALRLSLLTRGNSGASAAPPGLWQSAESGGAAQPPPPGAGGGPYVDESEGN